MGKKRGEPAGVAADELHSLLEREQETRDEALGALRGVVIGDDDEVPLGGGRVWCTGAGSMSASPPAMGSRESWRFFSGRGIRNVGRLVSRRQSLDEMLCSAQ